MARNSNTQSNFLGGELAPLAQGRIDLPNYKIGLANCTNMVVTEEGAVVRRGGTRMCGPTFNGTYAVTFAWEILNGATYDVEISYNSSSNLSWLRLWQGDQPVTDNTTFAVTAVSTSGQITLGSAAPWNTGDTIYLALPTGGPPGAPTLFGVQWAPIFNRQLQVTKIDTTHFTVVDSITALPITCPNIAIPVGLFAVRFPVYALPYKSTAQLDILQATQAVYFSQFSLILTCQGVITYQVILANFTAGLFPTFSVQPYPFTAGPYRPILSGLGGWITGFFGTQNFYAQFTQWISGGSYITGQNVTSPSGTGGIDYVALHNVSSATPPASDPTNWAVVAPGSMINFGIGFQASDVGRSIRLFSQPPPFNPTTTYTAGQAVTWNNVPYIALSGSTGMQPDENPTIWAANPGLTTWVDAIITVVVSANEVTVNLPNGIPSVNTNQLQGFTESLFSNTLTRWPACAAFHENRLWFAGAFSNQIDGSETGLETFRPSNINGDVLDNSAISEILLSDKGNVVQWIVSDQQGLLLGMQDEEWLVTATTLNNPLTPTSFQAHRQTTYGSNFSKPSRAGMVYLFIQRYARRVFEYLADVFSGRFSALPLNELAKHLTSNGGAKRLVYVENIDPIAWVMTAGGNLIGCTYRRLSRFVTEPPRFYAWHNHPLAGRAPTVSSISQGQTVNGQMDSVTLITNDGTNYFRQLLMPVLDENVPVTQAWTLDGAFTGIFGQQQQPVNCVGLYAVEDGTNMYFLGLRYQPATVRVWIAGIDFGVFTISNGAITVPYASDPNQLGTRAYISGFATTLPTNIVNPCLIQNLGYVPVTIGSAPTAVIKLLRNDETPESRTQEGPALGDTRRIYMASALLRTGFNGAATIAGDASIPYPMIFRQWPGGPSIPVTINFAGVWQDTVSDDYDYDGQFTITISGATPFALAAVSGFSEVEER